MTTTPKKPSATTKEGHFTIQKIYIKDLSLEAPNAPAVFKKQWTPEVSMQLSNAAVALGGDEHEITLSLTVTAKLGETTAYLVEVQQAGIFSIKGFDQQAQSAIVGSHCPSVLFPFAREAVSDIVTKSGFPQLLLVPINFDALYQQQLQQSKKLSAEETTTKH